MSRGQIREEKGEDEKRNCLLIKLLVSRVQTSEAEVHARTICNLAIDVMLKLLKRETL